MRLARWTSTGVGPTARAVSCAVAAIGLIAGCGGGDDDDDAAADEPADSASADEPGEEPTDLADSDAEPAAGGASGQISNAPPAGQTLVEVDGLSLELDLPGGLACNIEDDTVTFSNQIGDNAITVGGGLNLYDEGWLGSISVTIFEPEGEPGPVAYYPTPGEFGAIDPAVRHGRRVERAVLGSDVEAAAQRRFAATADRRRDRDDHHHLLIPRHVSRRPFVVTGRRYETMNEPMIPEHPVDVAVVGGGLAGLTAAACAARRGARTILLDSRSVGGRARSAERDGFTLNEGGHALYRAAGGWTVLSSLGVLPAGGPPPLDDAHTVWDGAVVDLPVGTKDVVTTRLLSTRSKLKLGAWFRNAQGLADEVDQRTTFGEWLDGERAGHDLRKYIATLARLSTYAARPEELPASTVLRQVAHGSEGVLYLDGGWQSLVDGLVGAARSAGVHIVERAPVTAIERTGALWTVATPDQSLEAGAVVLAAGGPKLAVDLLGADAAGWVDRAGPVMRAACLDIGSTADGHGVLLSSDEPLYCTRHAPAAELAPDGHTLYSVMRYLAPDDSSSAEENRATLDAHAARAGLPARHDRRLDRFLAAPVVAWGSPVVDIERPSGFELADHGVFAVGDWVGDRLLADASLTSGARAGALAGDRATVAA